MPYHHLLLALLSLLMLSIYEVRCVDQPARIVCHFYQWNNDYSTELSRYGVEDIPGDKCTHIVYDIKYTVNNTSWEIMIPDSEYELLMKDFHKLIQLRQNHPHLKIHFCYHPANYQKLLAMRDHRQKCIRSLVKFMKKYNFDGIDVDWLGISVLLDVTEADKDNFLYFVEDLRRAVDKERSGWEITMTAYLDEKWINNLYHVLDLCELLDAVYTTGYYFHDYLDDFLDVHSPLYKRKHDHHPYEKFNVNDGLMLWEEKGCPANKLVLGISFRGNSYSINKSITSYSVGTARNGMSGVQGQPGPYTKTKGYLAYYEICTDKGLKGGWDDVGMMSYAYNDTLWVAYENATSVQAKMDFIKAKGYAGAMTWPNNDDFHGLCGTKNILLKTIYDNMKNYSVPNGVVQADDKITTPQPEARPKSCTHGNVLPYPDRQKYLRCVDGVFMEFECKEGTEFSASKNICKQIENVDSHNFTRNETSSSVNYFYIENAVLYV